MLFEELWKRMGSKHRTKLPLSLGETRNPAKPKINHKIQQRYSDTVFAVQSESWTHRAHSSAGASISVDR